MTESEIWWVTHFGVHPDELWALLYYVVTLLIGVVVAWKCIGLGDKEK